MNGIVHSDCAALEFDTERLSVRLLANRDAALFCSLYTDAETMRFIGEPLSPEHAARCFREAVAAAGEFPLARAVLAIRETPTQQPLGICAIAQFDAGRSRAEVGIVLNSAARSRGFAREGLAALVNKCFELFPVGEIWVQCSALNPLVERMVSSIGFRLCGLIAVDAGPLAQRVWSVHRSSWCAIFSGNNFKGKRNVQGHQVY